MLCEEPIKLEIEIHCPRVYPGDQPLTKSRRNSGLEIVFVLERVGAKGPRGNWGRFAGVLKKLHDGHVILYLHAGHENWEYHARHVIPSLHARHAILRLHAGHLILSLHARHVILSLHAGHVLDVSHALLGTSISQTTTFKTFLNSICF